jgi:hypothetical protein
MINVRLTLPFGSINILINEHLMEHVQKIFKKRRFNRCPTKHSFMNLVNILFLNVLIVKFFVRFYIKPIYNFILILTLPLLTFELIRVKVKYI